MQMKKDIRIIDANLYFKEIETRVPLKFGPEVTTRVTCARAALTVCNGEGKTATGWGETPLSVTWVWPSGLTYEERNNRLKEFCRRLLTLWRNYEVPGHAMEIGHQFIRDRLLTAWEAENEGRDEAHQMPYLAALVCNSLFDLALHDAYGVCNEVATFNTYNSAYMNHDLTWYYTPEYREILPQIPRGFFGGPGEGANGTGSLAFGRRKGCPGGRGPDRGRTAGRLSGAARD